MLNKLMQKFQKSRKTFANGLPATKPGILPKGMCVNAVPIDEPDSEGWSKIAPVGSFVTHPNGPYEITMDDIKSMYANWARNKRPILVDVDHQSIWGNTEAAGWSEGVKIGEDCLMWKKPDWVAGFEDKIKNRAFRYFSPVFDFNAKDKRGRKIGTVLDSVAVTNRPYLDDEIDPIKNNNSEKEDFEMKLSPDEKATLIKNYGLAADVSDEDLQAAIIKNSTPAPDPPASKYKDDERETLIRNHNLAAEATDAEIDAAVEAAEKIKNSDEPDWAKSLITKVDGFEKVFNSRTETEQAAKVEQAADEAITNGKWRKANRAVLVAALNADFDATKADLDGRKKNSALPGAIEVPEQITDEPPKTDAEARQNFVQNARAKNLLMA